MTTSATIAPPSPCISVCALDDDGVCIGCYRSAEEIADWSMVSAGEKQEIVERARERKKHAQG